jgi:menaquinone-dependent protoporphyrinogen oxidase
MARVLVLYGTSEGHTEKIANTVGNALIACGCDADVIKAGTIDPDVTGYDGVIVAASVHSGKFQKNVVKAVRAHVGDISVRPNALLQVCLATLRTNDPNIPTYLGKIVDRFSRETGWVPAKVKPVAGALLYSQYNIVVRLMMRWIVSRAGGDTDMSRDYVYTDWDDLKNFAREFGRRLTSAAA